ncbi:MULTISPECIES: DMT family transporter [Brevundimonas]|uniref:Drug/metabolite transporter (DMT)-like permease n=1 Tax=Brevundimonas bullata TaxID=13160 RepID=A0A7W7IT96_9CAUL|nr:MULTISPECIES: DMT family transporter [Brevundimonas]MBB4799812.1 drug/metabolite transporter (DMT)-like permease [Brevundimonas bullata]MBB6384770.1 drug/metabolite transporter (DMT)-like permease [Brevundimonas bullata]
MKTLFSRLPPNAQGAIWVLLSGVTFVTMTVLVKHLAGDYPSHVQNFYRQTGSLIVAVPFMLRSPRQVLFVPLATMPPLFVRALLATVGMILLLYTYEAVPMAEANALSFTRPLWVVLLAAVFLRETIGPSRIAAVAVGFVGVLIIMRPWGAGVTLGWPHVAALVSALCLAGTITGVKSLTKDLSASSILVWSSIIGEILCLPFALADWRWPSVGDLIPLFLIGLLSAANQVLFIKGMAVGEAAVLAPIDYARLVLSIIAGLVVFGELPDAYTYLGAGVIVASTLYITNREIQIRRARMRAVEASPPEAA